MLRTTVAGLADHVGQDLGHSAWTVLDQFRINQFADVTGDHQWLHTDRSRAAAGPFGSTIAHGYLSLSLVSAVLLAVLEVTDADAAVNYGLDRVRFPSPVLEGSAVRGHGVLRSVKPVVGAMQTTTTITITTATGVKPAVVADVLTRFIYPSAEQEHK